MKIYRHDFSPRGVLRESNHLNVQYKLFFNITKHFFCNWIASIIFMRPDSGKTLCLARPLIVLRALFPTAPTEDHTSL